MSKEEKLDKMEVNQTNQLGQTDKKNEFYSS